MKPYLSWVEAKGADKVTVQQLRAMQCTDSEGDSYMLTIDPVQASQELWSWINLTLEKSATAQRDFHNAEELNGAEAYRRLVQPLNPVKPNITRRGLFEMPCCTLRQPRTWPQSWMR